MERSIRKAVIANIAGNTLEWYDFVLYGSLASIIAAHFFPKENYFVSLILTFSTFAFGFLLRPIGGIIFGHYGDILGRRKMLLLSVIAMVIPTTLLGFTPSFHVIGVAAPLIIVLLRSLQGLAVGGELTGAMTYLTELSPNHKPNYIASYSMFGVFAGLLLAPIVILITSYFLSSAEFNDWGWRIPFCLTGLFGLAVFYIRLHLEETPEFIQMHKQQTVDNHPLRTLLLKHKKSLLIGFGISIQVGIAFWLSMVFSITYLHKILNYPLQDIIALNILMTLFSLATVPLIGRLADIYPGRRILTLTCLGFIIFSYPLYYAMSLHPNIFILAILNIALATLTAAYLAVIPGQLCKLFPAHDRYSGVALSYNLALTLFGGTAPLIVTILLNYHLSIAPASILTIGAILSLIAALFLKNTTS